MMISIDYIESQSIIELSQFIIKQKRMGETDYMFQFVIPISHN